MKNYFKLITGAILALCGVVLLPYFLAGAIALILLAGAFVAWHVTARIKRQDSAVSEQDAAFDKIIAGENAAAQDEDGLKHTGMRLPVRYDRYYRVHNYVFPISGVDRADPDFDLIELGKKVRFVPEHENEFDRDAVRVEQNGQLLGYLPQGIPKDTIFEFAHMGAPFYGMPISADAAGKTIQINLALYKTLEKITEGRKHLKVKLINSEKKNGSDAPRHLNLLGVAAGDIVRLEFSESAQTYVVFDDAGNPLGELERPVALKIKASQFNDIFAVMEIIEDYDETRINASVSLYLS